MDAPILSRFRTLQRLAAAAVAALLWAHPANAQEGPAAIDLRVTDGETGAPLAGASVRLDGVGVGVSDARGTLHLTVSRAGTHLLEVAMLGRRGASPEVEVAPGNALELEVVLEPDVVPLPPMAVTARTRGPRGVDLDGDGLGDLDDRQVMLAALEVHAQAVKELTAPVHDPVIPQVRGRLLADPTADTGDGLDAGSCVPDLFVDGVPVTYTGDVYLGDLAQGEPDPRDGPPQFGQVTSPCGAILIWTGER
ncbi:MAG TPA: carboxypeptidase regulatory-like domain-containing protein [Longimicrobium sp.]|nr:carboxypeptidase regulatory-like domain-containing protein [Longimicrobium sp.]